MKGLIDNFGPDIYFHYYDYIDPIMTTGQERLVQHPRGPSTPEGESFALH
jgi:hypothetical protein